MRIAKHKEKALIIISLLIGPTSLLMASPTKKMSKRDKEYKAKHLKTFGRKVGYQGAKNWSNFLDMVIKYHDPEILEKMLKVTPQSRVERVELLKDLLKVHEAAPEFFVKTSYNFYKKNMDCVVRVFKTDPQLLTLDELKTANTVKSPSPLFRKYLREYNKTNFATENDKTSTQIYAKCQGIKQGIKVTQKSTKKGKKK